MTTQALRRIVALARDTGVQPAPRTIAAPGLAWIAPGRHANFRSGI
jgi:hypothetical protein